METRAHFIIIGLFTILGILGGLGFFIWLASVQIDRQYTQYGILFDNVSGLDQSADVFFNGVNVGRVIGIRIWEDDPRLVYVGIEIDSETPVSVDTVAQLESQGVTGVAYIALAGGAPDAARLTGTPEEPAIIRSRPSSFQSLFNSAPDILADAGEVLAQLRKMTGEENQQHVASILRNIDEATGKLDAALTDFSDITTTVSEATAQITVFTSRLEEIGNTTQSTLQTADETLASITQTFDQAQTVLDDLQPAITDAGKAFAAMGDFIETDLAPLSDDLTTTLGNADTALASMDAAFANADQIMATDLGPVLADARTTLAELTEATATVTAAIPGMVEDLRVTVAEIRSAVAAAAPGMRDFGQLGGEARSAIRSFNNLVQQISRDPAGFLLEDRVPDYRR